MQINNMEVDFKISRLKDAAAFEQALQNMQAHEEEMKPEISKIGEGNASLTVVITELLDMMHRFFIDATGVDVLSGCEDVDEAVQAYQDFLVEVEKQKSITLAAYSPDRIK